MEMRANGMCGQERKYFLLHKVNLKDLKLNKLVILIRAVCRNFAKGDEFMVWKKEGGGGGAEAQ